MEELLEQMFQGTIYPISHEDIQDGLYSRNFLICRGRRSQGDSRPKEIWYINQIHYTDDATKTIAVSQEVIY